MRNHTDSHGFVDFIVPQRIYYTHSQDESTLDISLASVDKVRRRRSEAHCTEKRTLRSLARCGLSE